ncbi:PREDICTED: uncharacterized protein LOC109208440 [Nicotiana attenuata]|nr:PREDICTED: uncharacterized protein LOC109208440 [Nicotiana attenuata]
MGLSNSMKNIVDASAGGAFLSKTWREGQNLLDKMNLQSNQINLRHRRYHLPLRTVIGVSWPSIRESPAASFDDGALAGHINAGLTMADENITNGEVYDDAPVEIAVDETSDVASKTSALKEKIAALEQEKSQLLHENDVIKQRIEKLKSSIEESRTKIRIAEEKKQKAILLG